MKISNKEAKVILKNDFEDHFSLVNTTIKKEIQNDIEHCLEKQEAELTVLMDEIYQKAKTHFNSMAEFKAYMIKNIEIKPEWL